MDLWFLDIHERAPSLNESVQNLWRWHISLVELLSMSQAILRERVVGP